MRQGVQRTLTPRPSSPLPSSHPTVTITAKSGKTNVPLGSRDTEIFDGNPLRRRDEWEESRDIDREREGEMERKR